MKRVAVTGIGMIDTLGNNLTDCSNAMYNLPFKEPIAYSDCPVDTFKPQKVFPVTSELELPDVHPKVLRTFDANIKYGLHAVHQALNDSGVNQSKNVAVIASNVTSGDENMFSSMKDLWEVGRLRRPRNFLAGMKDFFPGFIAQHWGFEGPNTAMNAACATSLFSLDYATTFVERYDYVVCASSDDPIQTLPISLFSGLGAVGTVSDPFGPNRDGLIPGAGAACFILESEEKAIARDAKVYAWLYPVGFGSDAYAATAPNPEGTGAKAAMNMATEVFNKMQIEFVSAHGTSTPAGDEVELNAIRELFGDIEIVAPKKHLGHTMGTCGLLEAAYGVAKCQRENKKVFLNNSFGFGGKCASQVVEVNL